MLFNSIAFAIFLPIVFILYWFVLNRNLKLQNIFLIASSYLFYGWWDWRFLSLIAISTSVDFLAGKMIHNAPEDTTRKRWLALSVIFNIGLLLLFKYFNFFTDSLSDACRAIGIEVDPMLLNIILPVGISFYTFQTLSYSIDIYRRKIEPTNDFLAFTAFVSFFPQLVAGPIERAANLIPQFLKKREFTYEQGILGVKQITYGLFKKIVIADSLAPIVNDIFANYSQFSGGILILGAIYFAIQLYCDFSGYSDIAIGVGRLFGFHLMTNFRYPYFSRSISEFWRRWHISLSSWFKDYVYIPLGGSRGGKLLGYRNVSIIFLVSGFWHGANWTYVVWGGIHALLILPSFILKTNRIHTGDIVLNKPVLVSIKTLGEILLTFTLVTLALIYFRSESLEQANQYLLRLFTDGHYFSGLMFRSFFIHYVVPFMLLDFYMMKNPIKGHMTKLNWLAILISIEIIAIHAFSSTAQQFIYFNF